MPGLARSPAAARRFSIRQCAMKSAAAKKARRNGRRCIAPGTRWAAAARRRCSYGHVETLAQRVDHLRQLRELQDETGGFTGFVPFAFEPQTPVLAHIKRVSAVEELRNLAVSRIYLDNFDHITAYWVSIGSAARADLAQLRRR